MTGRERMRAVLRKQPKDRLPWCTLVDDATLNGLPPELRGNGGVDFYRSLGSDLFLLNGWNTPHAFRSPELRWGSTVTTAARQDGNRHVTELRTPRGTLTSVQESWHPVKYPVDSLETLRLYRELWEDARFVAHDDGAALAALDSLVGDSGVVTRFWGPSTIPRLLEYDMGVTNFYYLLADHPEEMDGLIRLMHEREIEAFRCLATGPWESATLCENTSTYYISPDVYRRYNLPHQREFVERMHAAGKPAILHMCGHVRQLLPLIRETDCDGIHFLTPPPTGDTPWELALDEIGEELIILGCLDPTIFVAGPVEGIGPALDRLITPRLRRGNFILHPTADGLPVPGERFQAVQRWIEKNGR